jgi:hypothetical protein
VTWIQRLDLFQETLQALKSSDGLFILAGEHIPLDLANILVELIQQGLDILGMHGFGDND